MPRVQFTKHLVRYFPRLQDGEFQGATVAEVVGSVDEKHPGLGSYILDERGSLRKHVNIFVGDHLVHDRERLSDRVPDGAVVSVYQSLSGG
jgi:molybdopterin synthase sulfur carrier subunit